jgi:hypothetical protein
LPQGYRGVRTDNLLRDSTWHGGDVAVVLWLVERPLAIAFILSACVILALGVVKGIRRRKIKTGHVEEGILREG